MRLRWSELRPVLKAVSVMGVAVGSVNVLGGGIFLAQAQFPTAGPSLYLALLLSVLFLLPLLTALGLLFLPMTAERRDILGFVCLISSIAGLLPAYILLFFAYCSATHSSCS